VVASHGAKGYKTTYASSVGSLTYTDSTGQSQQVDLPTADQPVTVPGIARISLGLDKSHTYPGSAHAAGYALRIDSLASGSRAMLAHAVADVSGDVKHGLFRGQSAGIRSSALQNNASVGSQPLTVIPCQGTGGKVHSKDLAGITLDNGLVVQGMHSSQEGDQTKHAATGQAIGSVSSIDLGGGQLVATAIKGVANVKRTADGLTSNIKGSSIGTITANGQAQEFPPSDVIEIPGVAKLERNVVDKSKKGISVVALRVTLLDGTGAVIDLGLAKLDIKKLT
jgi:hypothetical protein